MSGIVISDGRSNNTARVTDDFRVAVESNTARRSHFISLEGGQTYNVSSHDATAAAGTFILYFKNDNSTKNFFVDLIRVGGVNAALWKVWFVTGTAAGGSVLTPTNLNSASTNSAEATVRGDDSITGLSAVDEIATARNLAGGSYNIPFDDTLVVSPNSAFAVEYDTGTTGVAEVLLRGYYE